MTAPARFLRGPNRWSLRPVLELDSPALAARVLDLQILCGCRNLQLHGPAVEYEDEDVARACLRTALSGGPTEPLREFAADVRLGPNTRALFEAARRRNIPVRRLGQGSLLLLGHGIRQRRLWGARSDATSSIGEAIGWEKPLAKVILAAAGIPTPEGFVAETAPDAIAALRAINAPVVVKPESANHGRSVFIGLSTEEEVAAAFQAASREGDSPRVIIERLIPGREHRVLVVGGRLAAASRGDPLYVQGDGVRTLQQIVDEVNLDPRRGPADECPLYPVEFDDVTLAHLARLGFTPASVVPAGTRVLLQLNGNLGVDVTGAVHPANIDLCLLAAEAIGLDIAGIDLVVEDISQPIAAQGGAVLEVNAMPGLMMHLNPAAGSPRPVDDIILRHLYPHDPAGRIPIACVLDDPETARALHSALLAKGLRSGLGSGADLLLHPRLEAAVFHLTSASIAAEGLPFDACDVAVMRAPAHPVLAKVSRRVLSPDQGLSAALAAL